MARKEQFQTRLDADHADAVHDYAEQHDVTQAEAVRRLVVAGLDAEQDDDDDTLDPEEIRDDLQQIRQQTATPDDDTETHRMNQMGATQIGGIAVGLGVIGAVASLSTTVGLTVAGIVGVAMIAWGIAPLID